MIALDFSVLELSLLVVLGLSALVHLFYLFYFHLRLRNYKPDPIDKQIYHPLSVLIAARNEEENLRKYLRKVLTQDYPDFEVVVINDRSSDDTADVLREYAQEFKHLKIVNVNPYDGFLAGKKFAIAMGIKAAKHDWLVFTDADCEPASQNWLREMSLPTDETKEILLGYSPYTKRKGLLNALIRYETFFTAVNYMSFALSGRAYMGVGRNLAYKKELFFKGKGFSAHMHIPSGDDDLFVNAHANPSNTAIQLAYDSQVWSEPKTTWSTYLKQKNRHLGAGHFYKAEHKRWLTAQIIFQVLFYASVIALCFFPKTIYLSLGTLALVTLLKYFVYPPLLKRLNYAEWRVFFPVLEFLLLVFLVLNAFLAIFVKKVKWK